jgi:copper oxidase (laccase) domain-containing protein
MLPNHRSGLTWFTFDLLSAKTQIVHGVFSRQSSSSSDLNLNILDPNATQVEEHHNRIKNLFGLEKLIYARQVHSDKIAVIDSHNWDTIPTCDVLFTREKNWGLMIAHADCQVALIFDPVTEWIGCIHSGWRGNVLNIYAERIWDKARKSPRLHLSQSWSFCIGVY